MYLFIVFVFISCIWCVDATKTITNPNKVIETMSTQFCSFCSSSSLHSFVTRDDLWISILHILIIWDKNRNKLQMFTKCVVFLIQIIFSIVPSSNQTGQITVFGPLDFYTIRSCKYSGLLLKQVISLKCNKRHFYKILIDFCSHHCQCPLHTCCFD